MPRWMLTVPSSPTTGSLPIARSYTSASVGSIRYAGPFFHGVVSSSPIRRRCATIPWWSGNEPVPIVAWVWAVLVGDVPTVARPYQVPSWISDLR
jgi:hypothetical protein